MRVRVLGAAAGGGFPQWNCACAGCTRARTGDPRAKPRTQDSVAVTADGERFLLLNASPDVLRQLERTPELHPKSVRHTPIAAIVLTNGDVDHVAGLLSLREGQPLVVAATKRVLDGLFERNAMLRTLQRFPGHLRFEPLELGVPMTLAGIALTPFAAPGKPPVHLRALMDPDPEDNIALRLEARGKSVVYAPSLAAMVPGLDAEVVMIDGTFWSDDELLALTRGRAADMGHLPISGDEGTLAQLTTRGRKIYVHLNNTNPVLLDDAPERRVVEHAGFEVAFDGMEIVL